MAFMIDDMKFRMLRLFEQSAVSHYRLPSCLVLPAVASHWAGERASGSIRNTCNHTVSAILLALVFASSSYANEQPGSEERAASTANSRSVQQFDDWQLRCSSRPQRSKGDASSAAACEIGQPLMIDLDGKPVELLNLAISKAHDKAGKVEWAMVVLTPLDVELSADFGVSIGSAEPALLRYRNCNRLGCFVLVPLDNRRVQEMKQAATGAVYFRLLNKQAVKVNFSLKGFTKAMIALSSGVAPSDAATDGPAPRSGQSEDGGN
jgi:invasion protein IalB